MAIEQNANSSRNSDVMNAIEDEAGQDDIVSVNDRGRRKGARFGPFLTIGAITLVVLIFGMMSLNILRSKLAGSKPVPLSTNATTISHSFAADVAPPLPGQSSAGLATSSAATATQAVCGDGTQGSELKGTDGIIVRNSGGQSIRVCPNGQVLAVTSSDAHSMQSPVQPIPVVPRSGRVVQAVNDSRPSVVKATDGTMMLNDGRYGAASLVPDMNNPQAWLAGANQVAVSTQPKTEGLLTAQSLAGSLELELTASRTPLVQASRIGDLNMLLPKGRTIDCGMSMRIISSIAGQASCIVTQNVFSANGKVLLIERGSEAVGEYRSGVSIGQKRLFVLWSRIITPSGVVINLDSPSADELGATGMMGRVDNHWFERIGSAFLLSTIQDAIQYEIAKQRSNGGSQTFVLGNTTQAGNTMAERILQQTINIPPTLYKNQGDRAVIYVARDLDFSNVYQLRPK